MYTLTGINTTTKNSKQIITNRVPNSSKLQRTSSSGVILKTPQQREILSKNGNKGLSNFFFGSHEYQKTHNEKIGVQKDFQKEYYELMTANDPEEKEKGLKELFTPTDECDLRAQTEILQKLLQDFSQKEAAKIALKAFLGTGPRNIPGLLGMQIQATLIAAQYSVIDKKDKKNILTKLFTPSKEQDILDKQSKTLQILLENSYKRKAIKKIALEAFLGNEPSHNPNIFEKQCEIIPVAVEHGILNEDDKKNMLTKLFTPSDDQDILNSQSKCLLKLFVNNIPEDIILIALESFLGKDPSNNLNLLKKQCEIALNASYYIQKNKDKNEANELPIYESIEMQSILANLTKYNGMIHNLFIPTNENDLEKLSTTVQNLLVNSKQTEIARIALKALEAFLEPRNIPNLLKKQYEIIPVAVECGMLDEDDKEEIITFLSTPSDDKGILKEQSKTLQNLLKDSSQREIAKIALKAFLEKVPTNNPKLRRKQQKAVLVAILNGIINRNNKDIMNKFFPSVMSKFIAKSIIKVGSVTKTIARI